MTRLHKESLAYAERMRKAKRRAKEASMAVPVERPMIKLSDLSEAIRQSEYFTAMQSAFTGSSTGGLGGGYISEDGYTHTSTSPATTTISPATTTLIKSTTLIAVDDYEALRAELIETKAKLIQAQASLEESYEIIEAINADMEDIEALKEENARLRIVGCLKVKASEPEVLNDGWIEWGGGSEPPELEDRIRYEVAVEGGTFAPYTVIDLGRIVRSYRWVRDSGAPNIIKYRVAI